MPALSVSSQRKSQPSGTNLTVIARLHGTNTDNRGTRRLNPRYAHVLDSRPIRNIHRQIFTDSNENSEQAPSRTRYSLDALTQAREIVTESPAVYRTICRSLPPPSERLPQERFMNFNSVSGMHWQILKIWTFWLKHGGKPMALSKRQVPFGSPYQWMHPRIIIHENGKGEGLQGFAQLEAPDNFS
jgi:hypothetical protein